MAKQYLDKTGLTYFWSKIKAYVDSHSGGGSSAYAAGDTYTITNYKVNGYVSSSTKSIYVTIHTPKSMENISSIAITKSSATVGARGISGYVKSNNTNMEDGYSLNSTSFTLTATKNGDHYFTVNITRSSAYTNVTNNTPVALIIGNMEFTFS